MIQDTSQAQRSLAEQKDRITKLLTRQAGAPSFSQDVGDISQSVLSALSQNTGAAGFQQSFGKIQSQRNEAQGDLYKIMQDEVTQGNEDAAAVDKAIKDIVGNDVGAYDRIARVIHDSPDKATRANANLLASRAAASMGYKPMGLKADEMELSLRQAQINKMNAEAKKAERTGNLNGIDPVLARQADKEVIINNRESSSFANDSLRSLDAIEKALFDEKGNARVNTGKGKSVAMAVGQFIPGVDSAVYQDVESKASRLALDAASMLKGQTSDKDVARSLMTAPGYDKEPEANKKIIKDQRAALKVVSEAPTFISRWRNKYGSTLGTDEQGRTFDEVFLDWQAARFKELGGTKDSLEGFKIVNVRDK